LAGMKVAEREDGFLYSGKTMSFLFTRQQSGRWVRVRGVIEEAEDGRIFIRDAD